jgi:uncharacterized OB-fold protein
VNELTARDAAEGAIDAEFWRGLDRGVLNLPVCRGCQRWTWPMAVRCGSCGSYEFDWRVIDAVGEVFTWTRTWYPFVAERAGDLPYVVVVVELPHAGRSRVLGVLRGATEGVSVGAHVRGRIEAPSAATFGLPSLVWELVDAPSTDAPSTTTTSTAATVEAGA